MQELQNFSNRLWLLLVGSMIAAALLIFTVAAAVEPYNRDRFKHWSDLDGDGLDTREELIVDQSLGREGKFWVCPYTGMVFTDPSEMDVDHVVSLNTAWYCGASEWTDARREQFANDPENLLLVWGPVNRSKGDKTPEQWLPSNVSFWDNYVEITRRIYYKYDMECLEPDPAGKISEAGTKKGLNKLMIEEILK